MKWDIDHWLANQGSPYYMKDLYREHTAKDSLWQNYGDLGTRAESTTCSMYHVVGWYDLYVGGSPYIGPWSHASFGEDSVGQVVFPGADAWDTVWARTIRWHNYYLKGEGELEDIPRVELSII